MATNTFPGSGGYTSSPPPPSSFSSRTAQIRSSLSAAIRPWGDFFSPSALSLPVSLSEASFRLRVNLHHFRLNYAVVGLTVLFLSLIFHPLSLIVFLVTLLAWLYLCLSRDEPLTIFNRTIDDRVVMIGLGFVTVLALIWSSVWLNVLVSAAVSAAVICLHAMIRFSEDVGNDSPYSALLSVVDSPRGAYSQV
ncbi:PRA1 (Prenylated rab acceptor) family protein [Actinidia rufa]|uniref:PRA1 family protein n=1 Tax=Actinidia rufa TaxID=165716 RepID=A0A7J0EF80_9ERIC|nr:PRA1 (Prenylated rab acceptor) family protein [Actinidia rufa]